MELFDNTFFINLEHRTDRLLHITNEFAKLDISGERINAIKMSNGAIGCTLSHIKCLELAIERGYERVFICEDDITFLDVELFKRSITQFTEDKNIRWDVIIIGGNNKPPCRPLAEYYTRVFNCQTTTGYIVQNSYYNTLLQNFKTGLELLLQNPDNSSMYAIDKYWLHIQSRDLWFIITPITVTQYENFSDIEGKITDYTGLMTDINKEWYIKQEQLKYDVINNTRLQRILNDQLEFSKNREFTLHDTFNLC
jgi:hypothetical protein